MDALRQPILDAIERCDREIAMAKAEACLPHSQSEHIGILLWECDWESHKIGLLEELALLDTPGVVAA